MCATFDDNFRVSVHIHCESLYNLLTKTICCLTKLRHQIDVIANGSSTCNLKIKNRIHIKADTHILYAQISNYK